MKGIQDEIKNQTEILTWSGAAPSLVHISSAQP